MKRALLASAAMAVLMSNPAHAVVTNEQLLQKLQAMEAEITLLKKRVRHAESKAITADAKASETKISMNPGPKFESADGKNVFKVGGFGQVDAANFNNDLIDHPNGSNLRRARLNISGTIAGDWNFKIENEFANNTSGLTDAFLEYTGFRPISVMAGQFKEPFSLETLTSDLHTNFIERALPTAFSPDRKIGAAISTNGGLTDGAWDDGWYTASVGFFGSGTGTASTDDEATDITGRVTIAPIAEPGRLLHFGVAGSHRVPDGGDGYRIMSKTENSIMTQQAVDTGAITNVEDVDQYGLEVAGTYGPFSATAEYMNVDLSRDEPGLDGAEFEGWYAEASYFLTGESRVYVKEQGRFDRTPPLDPFNINSGGTGAWSVMARASNIDLNEGPFDGGEATDYTVGLKWLPVANVMFSANYVMTNTDAFAVNPNDSPEAFLLRAQFDL